MKHETPTEEIKRLIDEYCNPQKKQRRLAAEIERFLKKGDLHDEIQQRRKRFFKASPNPKKR